MSVILFFLVVQGLLIGDPVASQDLAAGVFISRGKSCATCCRDGKKWNFANTARDEDTGIVPAALIKCQDARL